MTPPSPTFLGNGDVIYGRPHRSEDSISTKSSHHTNVMLRKHSEGRHSERSRQEHSSNRKRSVRLILNYLEMYIVHTKYARVLLYWEYKRTLACLVHTLRFDKLCSLPAHK